jgi:hypothetical protein
MNVTPSVVVLAYNPNTQKAEAGDLELEASVGCTSRACPHPQPDKHTVQYVTKASLLAGCVPCTGVSTFVYPSLWGLCFLTHSMETGALFPVMVYGSFCFVSGGFDAQKCSVQRSRVVSLVGSPSSGILEGQGVCPWLRP